MVMVTEKAPFASAFGMAILARLGCQPKDDRSGREGLPFTSKLCPLTIRSVGPPECPNNSSPLKISSVPRVGTAQVEFFGFTQKLTRRAACIAARLLRSGATQFAVQAGPHTALAITALFPKSAIGLTAGRANPHLPFWQIAGDSQQVSPQSA